MHIWPSTITSRIINNNNKHNPLVIHKKNVDHHSNSSQNRGRNQPTESHIYTGDEHHDGTNMGHNQSIVTQSLFASFDQDHMSNDQVQKSKELDNKVNNQWTYHARDLNKYNLIVTLHKRQTNQATQEASII
jgi:hypothetical protein